MTFRMRPREKIVRVAVEGSSTSVRSTAALHSGTLDAAGICRDGIAIREKLGLFLRPAF